MLTDPLRHTIQELAGRYPRKEAALIPALHAVQKHFNYIPTESVSEIAQILELPETRIYDVLSFYTMFKTRPVGRYHIQVCRTLSCHCRGAQDLLSTLENLCGVSCNGSVSSDGRFSIEPVECLGACTGAPVIQVNGQRIENITREKLNDLFTLWSSET